jgi:hypothetical protein
VTQEFDQEEQDEIDPVIMERMKQFVVNHAKRMVVLPISAITPYSRVQLIPGMEAIEPLIPNKRFHYFDITFEQYRVFYEIKKKAQHLTKDEAHACLQLISWPADEASPKEVVIILTMLFLFEQSRHPWLAGEISGKNSTVVDFYEKLPPSHDMSHVDWNRMISSSTFWSNSDEQAFPAITFDESFEELLKKRQDEMDALHTRLEILTRKIGLDKIEFFYKLTRNLHEQFPDEADEIELIAEYLFLVANGQQPTDIDSGNSSLHSKTVGEISMQLLNIRNGMILEAFDRGATRKSLYDALEEQRGIQIQK